ncbi:hypothetical protein [Streptomyces sp. NPDC014894]|uniref:hypothetical protein n=1 Tax=Streptomyces sp. NPDC014894 TaxID=3364931 RepID=UPI003700C496
MFKRIRDNREWREAQSTGQAMMEWAHRQQFPEPPDAQPEPAPAADSASSPAATPMVDDFLPPDLLSASRTGVTGMMMPWRRPLVVDSEVREWALGEDRTGFWR